MGKIFDYEGPVSVFLTRLVDLVWLNILFMICCIPIVTFGASTTAMYYVTLKMAKNEEGYITKAFFKSFKQNFKQATAISLIFILVIIVLVFDFIIISGGSFDQMVRFNGVSRLVLIVAGIVGVIISVIQMYVFPLLARFDNTVINTIKNAFIIGIRHLPYTVLMILVSLVPLVLMYFSNSALMLVIIQFSLVAYINSFFFNKIFVRYEPKDSASIDAEIKEADNQVVE